MLLHLWIRLHTAVVRDERGAGLVEYALLVSLIAVACFVAIQVFGGTVAERLQSSGSSIHR